MYCLVGTGTGTFTFIWMDQRGARRKLVHIVPRLVSILSHNFIFFMNSEADPFAGIFIIFACEFVAIMKTNLKFVIEIWLSWYFIPFLSYFGLDFDKLCVRYKKNESSDYTLFCLTFAIYEHLTNVYNLHAIGTMAKEQNDEREIEKRNCRFHHT